MERTIQLHSPNTTEVKDQTMNSLLISNKSLNDSSTQFSTAIDIWQETSVLDENNQNCLFEKSYESQAESPKSVKNIKLIDSEMKQLISDQIQYSHPRLCNVNISLER